MNSVQVDFDTNFRPADEQISYASKYATDFNLPLVYVAVNFPGKQRGLWIEGQVREVVYDGELLAMWANRDNALNALDTGNYGTALFAVWQDGHAHVVDELS